MKTKVLLFLLGSFFVAGSPGCSTAPAQRTSTFTTLKVVGLSAKAGVDSAALLLKDGKITVQQWESVANFYDLKFQPAFALAVATASSDLNSLASPELQSLSSQLLNLVASLK